LGGGVKMEFVLIRPGSFVMGSDDSWRKDEKPAHKVTLTKTILPGQIRGDPGPVGEGYGQQSESL